jgi:protein arginine kinase
MGNGLRAVIFIHLPALVLTKEVEKILRGVMQIGLAVRGIYGEGSEIKGNLFQISNQITLGQKEEEVLDIMEKIAHQLIDFEKKARVTLLDSASVEIQDKIFRAEAILRSARTISTDEVINLTSALRLGVGLGLTKSVTIKTLNEILVFTRPANLQLLFDRSMEAAERDQMRAEYIRGRLAHHPTGNQ